MHIFWEHGNLDNDNFFVETALALEALYQVLIVGTNNLIVCGILLNFEIDVADNGRYGKFRVALYAIRGLLE